MAAQMNDGHRRFLQTMMSHGILEGSEARALHRHCCETHKVYYAHDKLDEFINTINTQLQPMFMQIRKGKSEEDGRPHYALINLAETEITRMASDYAENELELFRKAMDLIVVSENGFASSTDILNLADQLQTKKMKKKEVEQVLQGFVQENWLCESQMCESCGIKIHLPCVARYFRGRMDPRCPQCNDFWPHEIPEIRTAESHVSSSNSSTSSRERAAPSRTKRGR
ncbi:non-structural maintenance of chromosomes element 1 homolog isoform X2 [Latimeria chalumnae]|uniref:non-structural maintenance of chromosomes element 1 homolog isoform X2 n=1 Tax=Latimeria chalumnae TaxID=7897 RepID=UPI0003C17041|nr:PREDICTED: non-structural maintenance of chromosomes element 1 homolog isoform X2 [Latimeria chalumnae]|eukprot:XP_006011587.1 PREDICTED: non-structural maintenance of chromosomes element 1 homolog isoform X2 [Latimeria chalumnae]